MKQVLAMAAVVALVCAPAAFADTIENGYGNTFVVTAGDVVVRYHFNADGTFAATAPDGTVQSGRYEIADSQICFLGSNDARSCAPLVSGKTVGDTWQQLDANGNQISVTLEAGR